MTPSVTIHRRSPVPLHRQIYESWRDGILRGRMPRGARVPSTREVAGLLGVARATVTTAYDQLVAEGYFETAHGSGTFVCRELPEESLRAKRTTAVATAERPAIALSEFGRRLEPDWRRHEQAPGVVNLSTVGADLTHFPLALWRRLLGRHLRRMALPALAADRASGHEPLRREIAAYLARTRAVRCTPDQVIVLNGSQQAIDLAIRLLVNPGDEVAVEDPGYPGARRLMAAHGAVVRPIPVAADGMKVERLGRTPRLVHVTPSHQFPSGVSMSLSRRLELIRWARENGAVILEDDYDSEYRYKGLPLPAMQGLADRAPIVYIGTFSNVMFRWLRIGYVVVPPELVAPFARAKQLSDRQTPVLEQAALAEFIADGHLERHVRRMRRLYRIRRDVTIGALRRYFGDGVAVGGDAAGMYLLARFRDRSVARRGRGRGVYLHPTTAYYAADAPANEFVIGFSSLGPQILTDAIARLADT